MSVHLALSILLGLALGFALGLRQYWPTSYDNFIRTDPLRLHPHGYHGKEKRP